MVTNKALLRQWLLDRQSRVYSIIVHLYGDKIAELKPRLFIQWLAVEIDVPVSAVNIASLNSALTRSRRKAKAAKSASAVGNPSDASTGVLSGKKGAATESAGSEDKTTIKDFKPSDPFSNREQPPPEIRFL